MSKRSEPNDAQPGLFDAGDEAPRASPAPRPRPLTFPPASPAPPPAPVLPAGGPDAAARAFATDPRENVVLEASAGTGKTSVLVQRYLNLLGAGVDPVNILAMTFTRKAAAEMRERIITALRSAARTSDEGRARWLRLRDRVGDIAISTIDAFCYSLLREFPLEAGLDPGFRVAEEAESARLVDDSLDQALRVCRHLAREDPDVALVLARLTPARLRDSLAHLLDRRLVVHAALDRYLRGAPANLDLERVGARVASTLAAALRSVPGGLDAFLADGPVAHPRYIVLTTDLRRLDRGALTDAAALGALVEDVKAYFLTQDGRPRSRIQGYRKEDAISPEAWKRHGKALVAVAPTVHAALAAAARDLNVVLARGIGRVFAITLGQYRRTLAEHDVVDFPELIERAVELLRQMDEFSQSRFRLESRYHHVLVDEFQDTSRRQWELVALLVRSWGEGFGLVDDAPLLPSLFIVGDRKQSIYRFRDAKVALLDEAAATIDALRPAGATRRYISRSFRALPALLAFVNDVCREVAQGASRPDAFTYGPQDHFPIDDDPAAAASRLLRDTPLGLVVGADVERCAELVAGEIARLLASGSVRDRGTGVPRAVAAGDIAILFRSRESHREFEAALDARSVPTYVYKGLGFYDSDEIKDLIALVRFLAAPESELRAAAFARSRFVRLSDPGLRALAGHVSAALGDATLPAAAAALDDEDQRVLDRVRSSLAAWLPHVDRWRPAELLDHILAESGYVAELGGPRADQARENVKKLRGLVRRIDNRGYATLARLAAHIDRLSVGDEANAVLEALDAVNLMTVHAAKGLEFPIVFLVNISRGVAQRRPAIRVRTDATSDEAWVAVDAFQSEADVIEPVVEREETKRLLYVALTRARDRLYLSTLLKEGGWRAGAGSLGSVLPGSLTTIFVGAASAGHGERLSWTGQSLAHDLLVVQDVGDTVVARQDERSLPTGVPALPAGSAGRDAAWRASNDAGRAWPRVSATSRLADGIPDAPREDDPSAGARLVGRLVHRLFQSPADGAEVDLGTRAARLIRPDERIETVDVEDVAQRAAEVFARLRAQGTLRDVLASGRAEFEVPFSFVDRPHGVVVRGAIDCLVRRPDGSVVVIEVKTGRAREQDRAQLEAYVAAARALFPGALATGLLIYA